MTDTHYHYCDFPFEEIRRADDNYFNTVAEAMAEGFAENQVWSVCHDDEDEDGVQTDTYGPAHHYVNRLGYVATKDFHDGNTYYIEQYSMDDFTED